MEMGVEEHDVDVRF